MSSWDDHLQGHRIGAVVKYMRPALFNSLATSSHLVSVLATKSLECAFAEGFAYSKANPNNTGSILFLRSVSRYQDADPTEVGAPDLSLEPVGPVPERR